MKTSTLRNNLIHAAVFLVLLSMLTASVTNVLVTDGTVADWFDMTGNEFCVQDQGGANDFGSPAINDITVYCVSPDDVNSRLYLLFGFDDVTISGGNNTSACVLVDTPDGMGIFNGNFNYAICTTLGAVGMGAQPTVVIDVQLYSCTDMSSTGCSGASLSKVYSQVSMGVGDYDLVNDEASIFAPMTENDSYVEACIPYADLGVTTSNVILSSMISYPDENTLTSPKDNVFSDPSGRVRCDLGTGLCTLSGPLAAFVP